MTVHVTVEHLSGVFADGTAAPIFEGDPLAKSGALDASSAVSTSFGSISTGSVAKPALAVRISSDTKVWAKRGSAASPGNDRLIHAGVPEVFVYSSGDEWHFINA